MQDIRQSKMYGNYLRRIGWIIEEIDGVKVFIRKFPLFGSIIKIQRPEKIPRLTLIDELAKKYRAWYISLETKLEVSSEKLEVNGFKVNNNPYLPTKTIRIDLIKSEEEIFKNFTEAKRRGIRKAVKNGVVVLETDDIETFIKLKAKDFWPLGWFMAKDVRALWESFRPENAAVLLGFSRPPRGSPTATPEVPVSGVLLLFYANVVYYWMAASTNEGKKLFAPTLLVWQALKLAKKKGCRIFDFEGIYDERFHKATRKWQGFTKFKQGFGGIEISYPEPLRLA